MSDRVRRMLDEAEARIQDAEVLARSLHTASDSQAIIKILALEVLLKAAQLQCTGKFARSHRYIELWDALPSAVQQEVIRSGSIRYSGHADLTNVPKLLCIYEFIFTKVRYHYELYEGYSIAEQQAQGEEWVQRGAPTEEALVQYFPMELSALLFGLVGVIKNAL